MPDVRAPTTVVTQERQAVPDRPAAASPTAAASPDGDTDAEAHDPAADAGSPVLALLRAHHAVSVRLDDVLDSLGLTSAKLSVLRQLSAGPLPLGELALRQSCVRSNITQMIDRLEADGLVYRVHDPADRRVIRAEITPAGRQKFAAGRAVRARAEDGLLAALAPEERTHLASLLNRLAESV